MTSKADWTDQWSENTPEERRGRLNELGAVVEKTDEEWREHDALAAMVADDENEALRAAAEQQEADQNQ